MEFSTTQRANLLAFAGSLYAIIKTIYEFTDFGSITGEQTATFVFGIGALFASVYGFIERYKKGGVTLVGTRTVEK